MSNIPLLYCKHQVIANTRIKPSDWYKYRNNGIIPPPIGREGNEHRWSSSIINAISDQTGVTAINTGSDKGGVQLIAADGRNITVAKTTAATAALTGLADAAVQSGTFNLTSINGNPITISSETAAPSTLLP
jgi:hypothetical protein